VRTDLNQVGLEWEGIRLGFYHIVWVLSFLCGRRSGVGMGRLRFEFYRIAGGI
jgi:hypothetical protein